jgi:hypothetical protein
MATHCHYGGSMLFLVATGIYGVKTKRLKAKNGLFFEGTTAKPLGVVYVLLGCSNDRKNGQYKYICVY